jgi:site-specific DNA recombinase
VLWCYSGRTHDLAVADDRFRTGLDALLAEREAEETAGRVQRAMRANANDGRPHGRRLYGYRRVYDDATGGLVDQVPHPDEAPVVREIFHDYLAGTGVRTIVAKLNKKGTTTSTGARWADAQVRRVLTNPAYAARRVHRGEVVGPATWPPLVDGDRFDRVQARLAQAKGRTRQTAKARLLTAVGRCGVCGGKLRVLYDRRRRHYYECIQSHCVARDEAALDGFVTDVVLARLALPDVAEALSDAEPAPEVSVAQAAVAELQDRLEAAVNEYTAGNLTAATLARIEGDLLPRIAEAEKVLRNAVLPLEVDVPADGLSDWWEALSGEVRREVVGALLAAVVVHPTGKGRRTFDPDAVSVEWRR